MGVYVRDFFDIDLTQVDVSGLDRTPRESQHGRTQEDYEQLVESLERIRGWQAAGRAGPDFHRMADSPDPSLRRIGNAYILWFESQPIKLDWDAGRSRYAIVDGHHRILAAQDSGLLSLPARVTAPDRETLERLRDDGREASRRVRPTDPEREKPERPLEPVWERRGEDRLPPWERERKPGRLARERPER